MSVPEEQVEFFRELAGDGTTAEKCRRILAVCREAWWGKSFEESDLEVESIERTRLELEASRDAWADHVRWVSRKTA
jgi:hypothetical protein